MKFIGNYFFLSNFYLCSVKINGIIFPSSENAYHYFRTNDKNAKESVIVLEPRLAKKLSKTCKTKQNWNEIKLGVMYYVCKEKFTQNIDLAEKLLETGNIKLIEHNNWGDTFWGVCNGEGENHLGEILMKIREEFNILNYNI